MSGPAIVSDPQILGGKPIIAGTRLTVGFVLDNLAAGRTPAQLITKNQDLSLEAIDAAKKFALEVMRDDDINVLRIPLRIRHLVVALQPSAVANTICAAFEWVRLGHGASLRQMEVMDNYGTDNSGRKLSHQEYSQLKYQDETTNWKALTIVDIETYDYLSHADAEAFRFYIPALMIYGLANPHSMWIVLFHLYPQKKDEGSWKYRMMQYSALDAQQKRAVAHYLWYLLDTSIVDYENPRQQVERALENYWMQFLEPSPKK